MTLAAEANGLDVAAIHPSKGAKYSPNLHKWLTMRSRKHHAWTSRVFSDNAGALWIGMLDNGDLFGARLMQVLCNGTKAEHACWVGLGTLVEIADFWKRYTAVGRCAIDTAHSMHFLGDDTRWRTNGDHRECLWCGSHSQKLRRWVEPVERSAWEPVTPTQKLWDWPTQADSPTRATGCAPAHLRRKESNGLDSDVDWIRDHAGVWGGCCCRRIDMGGHAEQPSQQVGC